MSTYSVSRIVRMDAPFLSPETPLRRAAAVLADTRSAAAPVVGDDGGLVGILSQKDCFRAVLQATYYREWKGNVADQMTRGVITIDLEEEIIRSAEMFLAHPHRVFPVLQSERVVGLLYRSDVFELLVRQG